MRTKNRQSKNNIMLFWCWLIFSFRAMKSRFPFIHWLLNSSRNWVLLQDMTLCQCGKRSLLIYLRLNSSHKFNNNMKSQSNFLTDWTQGLISLDVLNVSICTTLFSSVLHQYALFYFLYFGISKFLIWSLCNNQDFNVIKTEW